MRKAILFLSLIIIISNSVNAQYSDYIGEYFNIPYPGISAGDVHTVNWLAGDSELDVLDLGTQGARVKITKYFSGYGRVYCDIYYTIGEGVNMKAGNTRRTFTVSCKKIDISVNPTQLEMNPGEVRTVKWDYSLSSVTPPTVDWYSTKTSVVRVIDGKVTAVGPGEAYVVAKSNYETEASCYVKVNKIDPTDVAISNSEIVYVGETTKIIPILYPSNAQTTFSWYCRDKSTAIISDDGTISGLEEGIARVYCVTGNGLYSEDCYVTVKYRTPTSISLNTDSLYLPIDHKDKLFESVLPSNAKYTLFWESSDDKIVSISQNGEIEAKQEGNVIITVTTNNGYTAHCSVVVPSNPTKIDLFPKASLIYGESRKLKYDVYPKNSYVSLKWDSSDKNIVNVDNDGILTGINPGKATISVKTSNNITDECEVEVQEPFFSLNILTRYGESSSFLLKDHPTIKYYDGSFIVESGSKTISISSSDVRKFTLSMQSLNSIPSGIRMPNSKTMKYHDTYQMEYVLLPQDYDIETSLSWRSSDNHVAIVDNKGEVYATGGGTANITITSGNGVSNSCSITVLDPTYVFVIKLIDGSEHYIQLIDKPVVKYTDNYFIITSSNFTACYSVEEVQIFYLDEKESIDTNVQNEEIDKATISSFEDIITINGVTPNSTIDIISINGVITESFIVPYGGNVQFSINKYPSGVYIIKTKTVIYKIIKQ